MVSFTAERRSFSSQSPWLPRHASRQARRNAVSTSPPASFVAFRPSTAWWSRRRKSAPGSAPISCGGGNAVDAAVATGFALAVTYPRAGNIGGGGFMMIHSAERGEDIAIDYRETAPAAATRDMFLGADGKPDIAKSRDSALGIGVPGTVAGLALALEKYGSGKFTLAELFEAGHRARARWFCHCRRHGGHAARHRAAAVALAGLGEDIFPRRRQLAAGRRHPGANAIWRRRFRPSRRRDRADSTTARSRKNWRPGFARPVAS